jgi:hypothetical protein
MPRAGFEPTIPVLERAKAVHALDRAATVIGQHSGLYTLNRIWGSRNDVYEELEYLCLLLASRWFLTWRILRPWRWRRHFPPKRWLTFKRLHSVELLIYIKCALRSSAYLISSIYNKPQTYQNIKSIFRNIEFSDSIHRPGNKKQTKGNTTFRKLDMFPSSCAGKKPILLGPLERASPNHWSSG